MKYIVFTDGAGNRDAKRIGCSYMIYTTDTYIDSGYKSIQDNDNPTQAETIAVGFAAGVLLEKIDLKKSDTIDFNVDCLAVIEFCTKYLEDTNAPIYSNNKLVVISVQLLRKLAETCNVKMYKVRGHKTTLNPNSYVDRLAKLGARK